MFLDMLILARIGLKCIIFMEQNPKTCQTLGDLPPNHLPPTVGPWTEFMFDDQKTCKIFFHLIFLGSAHAQ